MKKIMAQVETKSLHSYLLRVYAIVVHGRVHPHDDGAHGGVVLVKANDLVNNTFKYKTNFLAWCMRNCTTSRYMTLSPKTILHSKGCGLTNGPLGKARAEMMRKNTVEPQKPLNRLER